MADVDQFLDILFGGVLDGEHKIEVRILKPTEDGKNNELVTRFKTEHPKSIHGFIEENGWGQGHHVFFSVVPRPIEYIYSLWADLDGADFQGGKEQARLVAEQTFPLKPSAIVDSGHGYHLYWRLHSPVVPQRAQSVLKELETIMGGDSVSDPERLLRLPETENPKSPPARCAVEVLRQDLTYKIEDFNAILQLSNRVIEKIRTGDSRGYHSRSEMDFFVVTSMVREGVRNSLIKQIFAEWPVGKKSREEPGDHYIDRTITQAHEEIRREDSEEPEGIVRFFIEEDDSLWASQGEQEPHCVASFWFEPHRVIENKLGDIFEGDIHAGGHAWSGEQLRKHSFDSARQLKQTLRLGAWRWLGSDREAQLYLGHIMDTLSENDMPRARGEIAIGRHDDFWVSPDITFTQEEIYTSIRSAPIAFVDRGLDYPKLEYTFESDDEYRPLCQEIFSQLPNLVTPDAVWTITGWNFAAPLKPLFREAGFRFPHLDLYGTRGSGKTTIIRNVFQPLLGGIDPTYHDCQTTTFVLMGMFSSTNAFPVLLAEFHRSMLPTHDYNHLIRTLKLAYDSGYDSRGRPDQTVTVYQLTAPVILDGEDALSDPAVKERAIIVSLSPEDVMEGTSAYRAYKRLVDIPLYRFAGRFIRYTLGYDVDAVKELFSEARARIMNAFPSPMPDRVRNNFCVVSSGLVLLERYAAKVGFDVPAFDGAFLREHLTPSLDEVVEFEGGRTRMVVDAFVEDIVNEWELVSDSRNSLNFFARYDEDDNSLWFHLTTAYNWWLSQRRHRGLPALDSAALKNQLQERGVARRNGGAGQYILDPKTLRISGSSKWCYGVDVDDASRSGLDIPEELTSEETLVVKLKGNNGGAA
ncbi:hypothetical protein GF373_17795 [bacterium]|nr:hypothetical protein [bacterium]